MPEVVLLSCELYLPGPGDHPEHSDSLVYMLTEQIHQEDSLLAACLSERGIQSVRVDWADSEYDWSAADLVLFRTPWDYMYRFAEFSRWLERVSDMTCFLNPLDLVRWNLDKHYLQDLAARGIRIVPTEFAETGSALSLEDWHVKTGWRETVLKPAISAGGRHTYRLNPENRQDFEGIFGELLAVEPMMLQPFLSSVVKAGEWSVMIFDGRYSHAVLKRAKEGDFRVQDDFGGTVSRVDIPETMQDFAVAAVRACDPLPAYARVDVVLLDSGEYAISELELFEPELWMRFEPASASLLADAVSKALAAEAD